MAPRCSSNFRGRLTCSLIAVGLALIAMTMLIARGQAGPTLAYASSASESAAASTPLLAGSDLRASAQRAAAQRIAADQRAERRAEKRKAAKREAAKAAKRKAALAEVSNAAGEPLNITGEACEDNLALAAKHGLLLPDGWAIHCVGPGLDWDGNSHWGVTCPYDSCPEGAGPYVSISNPTYYVVAHELCHANYGNDELMADSCAAEHGASLDTSPYQ